MVGFCQKVDTMQESLRLTIPDSENSMNNPPLESIYFYITGDCNLACRHCWVSPMYQRKSVSQSALDFDIFCNIIDEAKPLGLTSVKLTGGEPLIHPRIEELLSFIRQENLSLNLESNGIALTPEIADMIASIKNPFVSISLDGIDASTHEWMRGVIGSYDMTLKGIRTIINAGIKPQIIMTLTRRNVHQIEALLNLAQFEGAESVKFNILQPVARGKSLYEQGESLSVLELIQIGSWIEKDIAPSAQIRVNFSHPYAFQPLNRLFHNNYFCGTCRIHRILGVLHDGSYALCGIGQTVPELIFGHASTDRLSDLWYSEPTLQKIRKGIPDQLKRTCRECVMKNLCLGYCVAQNFISNHDLFAPFWYCEEAAKMGLFPETRVRVSNDTTEGS
ncbi:MAG: SynChlorMet cassette radical SAM/SPASM protein ScmF [Candidatus Helarchaeota archaeon]|nr:SynChlorMet cassette radical SAM/SPASM protein ScmF [Candidatus Helarchaeota archaeon]